MKKNIVLKLSGEILAGKNQKGIDATALAHYMQEIKTIDLEKYHLAIVIGGGNLYRGKEGKELGLDKINSDHMGMLATAINGIALSVALEKNSIPSKHLTRLPIAPMVMAYNPIHARKLMQDHVLVISGGTGVPCFTSDSAGALTAIELGVDLLIKGTNVDGVYATDPKKNPKATYYSHLFLQEALDKKLGVLDTTAMMLCIEHNIPIAVYNAKKKNRLKAIITEGKEGTFLHP